MRLKQGFLPLIGLWISFLLVNAKPQLNSVSSGHAANSHPPSPSGISTNLEHLNGRPLPLTNTRVGQGGNTILASMDDLQQLGHFNSHRRNNRPFPNPHPHPDEVRFGEHEDHHEAIPKPIEEEHNPSHKHVDDHNFKPKPIILEEDQRNEQRNGNGQNANNQKSDQDEIQEAFSLLEDGERLVQLSDTYKDIILVIGNTGVGKSTLVQFLAKDNSLLKSVETGKGSSKFLIEDVSGTKISKGSSTFESKTLYPELVVDTANNLAYYDCPGFGDSRGLAKDIAATYFTKLVTNHANSIKIIVVEQYSSLDPGSDRTKFPTLVNHVSEFLPHLAKFNHSIALVVAKVENQIVKHNGNYQLVPDEQIVSNIGEFIAHDAKLYFEQVAAEGHDPQKYQNSIDFINAITTVDSETGKFNRIGIFRKPDEAGTLDKTNPMLQKEKLQINNMIKTQISYQPIDDDDEKQNDFGYTVGDKTKVELVGFANLIGQKINDGFEILSHSLDLQLKSELATSTDWNETRIMIEQGVENVKIGIKQLNLIKNPTDYITKYETVVNQIGSLGVSPKELEKIHRYGKYLIFLEHVVKRENELMNIKNPLEELEIQLADSVKWHRFFAHVEEYLSAYKIQSELGLYNVADLKNWGEPNAQQGIHITSNNFVDFVHLVKYNQDVPQFLSEDRLKDLEKLLGILFFRRDANITVSEDKLIVKGHFAILSKLKSQIMTEVQAKGIKLVKIYATNAIFIDDSLKLPGISVTIISPKFEVIGSPHFQLDGLGLDNIKIYDKPAKSGLRGQVGSDGQVGGVGGNAGNFIGIGKTFVNLEYLNITANGGSGGRGQDGGSGGDGLDGVSYWPFKPSNGHEITFYNLRKYWGNEGQYWDWGDPEYKEKYPLGGGEKRYYIHLYGSKGENGHKGGNGGLGGKGGHEGAIRFQSTDGKLKYEPRYSFAGKVGINGEGGKGGKGGSDGPTASIAWASGTALGKEDWAKWIYYGDLAPRKSNYPNGDDGIIGGNKENLTDPQPQVPPQDWSYHLNEFKAYLRENMINPITKAQFSQFLTEIETNLHLKSIYNAEHFLDDMISLEKQFYSLYRNVDLQSSYEFLLKRVEEYADKIAAKIGEKNNSDKRKALAYLYTSALSKLSGLKQGMDKNLIIDLKYFIEKIALKNINDLKTTNKQIVINTQKAEYENMVKADIEEAKKFIENDLTPSIDSTVEEIDEEVRALIQETKDLIKAGEKKKEELERKRKELKKKLVLSSIFSVFKVVGQVASFCGPAGAAIGAVAGAGTSIAESLTLDDKGIGQTIALTVPEGVKNSYTEITKFIKTKKDAKINALKNQTEEIKKATAENENNAKDNEILKELKDRLGVIETILDVESKNTNADNNFDSLERVDALQLELSEAVEKTKSRYEKDKEIADKNEGKIIDTGKGIYKFIREAKVISVVSEQYNKIKGDQNAMEAVGPAVEEAVAEIRKLQNFERKIYQTLVPMITGMSENVNEMKNTLGSKSHVGLDVTKWHVQSTLKELIEQVNSITKGFKVEPKFTRSIDKLTEALVTLINIYDRIQTFHDKHILANYIANIGSPGSLAINLTNSAYKSQIDALDQSIQSNLILVEFGRITSAFKQWVFPFADRHLETYYLPSNLEPSLKESSIDELIKNAEAKVSAIKHVLDQYQSTIGEYDKFIDEGEFQPNAGPNGPFYTWSNVDYNNEINDLLSGKPITIYADVSRDHSSFNEAIKFKRVEVILQANDEGSQQALDNILSHFSIVLTHTGNSYYSFGGRIFVINTQGQVISHSFSRERDGTPTNSNEVYKKLLKGDILLSPYCFWTFQLDSNGKSHFNELKEFVKNNPGGINILLVGKGKFISEKKKGSFIGPLHLDKYYQAVDSVNLINQD